MCLSVLVTLTKDVFFGDGKAKQFWESKHTHLHIDENTSNLINCMR